MVADKKQQHDELLQYYSQQPDKGRLGAVKDKLDGLSKDIKQAESALGPIQGLVQVQDAFVEKAKTALKQAERALEKARYDCEGIQAEVNRLSEQP